MSYSVAQNTWKTLTRFGGGVQLATSNPLGLYSAQSTVH